jgi:hypothetical protein
MRCPFGQVVFAGAPFAVPRGVGDIRNQHNRSVPTSAVAVAPTTAVAMRAKRRERFNDENAPGFMD